MASSLLTLALFTLLAASAAALGRKKRGSSALTVLQAAHRDTSCFTQGLLLHAGLLYESCGLYGESSLRVVRPHSWEVLGEHKFSKEIFAEGIAVLGDRLFVLTWTSRQMFVFDIRANTDAPGQQLPLLGEVSFHTFTGEGWGLTSDGVHLIASDGSNRLTYFLPPTAEVLQAGGQGAHSKPLLISVKQIEVVDAETRRPVRDINELEFANGLIYANIWYKDALAVIDPGAAAVRWVDARGLYPALQRPKGSDCFNGIAHNASDGTFIVTGKKWDRHFRVAIGTTDP